MAKPILALVGGQTLLGREISEIAEGFDIRPMDTTDNEGKTLVRGEDDLAVMSPVDKDIVASAAVVMLAGDLDSSAKVRRMRNSNVIDLTGVLEVDPKSRLRAPLAEAPGVESAGVQVIAHPAASMLALFYRSLHAVSPILRSVANIYHPASEFGTAALTELQQQTTGLLTFQNVPKKLFDAQAAFAMLARLGEDSPHKLEKVELRIERNLVTLLAGSVPLPSLRLSQAPVFHGLSASVWIEFEVLPDLKRLMKTLSAAGIDVRGKDLDPPNNVQAASQDGVAVGAIEVDRNSPNAAWFWLVADNNRLTAQNAILVAKELLKS